MSVKAIAAGVSVDKRIRHRGQSETWLSRLAVSVVVVYIFSSPLPLIVGSLQVGDLCLVVAVVLTFLSRRALNSLVRFFRSGYFLLSFFTSAAMLMATLNAPLIFENLKSIAQLMTVLWLLIPLVAVGLAEMRDPLRFLEIGAWLYVITFVVGAILQFGLGLNWIVSNSGNNRFFMHVDFGYFVSTALCLSVAYLFMTRPVRLRYLLLFLGSLLPIIFAASRTGIVASVLVIVTAILIARRGFSTLAVGLIVIVLTTMLLSTGILQGSLGILDRSSEFFEDSARLDALSATWQIVLESPANLLFGVGWGQSGYALSSSSDFRVVAHNLPLQVLGQAGLFTAIGMFSVLVLPLFWWFNHQLPDRLRAIGENVVVGQSRAGQVCEQAVILERTLTLLLFVNLLSAWMFHPISYWRILWLPFAALMGIAYRLHCRRSITLSMNRTA